MDFVEGFKKDLFADNHLTFEEKAFRVFEFQFRSNFLYKKYALALKKDPASINSLEEIPFLPISFFKSHKIVSTSHQYASWFESSGTTGSQTSKLYFYDEPFYWENAARIFESFFGSLSEYSFFFLLPSYLERKSSSLVSMADFFWQKSDQNAGGFYLYDIQKLKVDLKDALSEKPGKVILWGVTFALLDFVEQCKDVHDSSLLVFETGGMKGRGKEPIKAEVHSLLKQALGVSHIYSEYGMTELFSQAYSLKGQVFKTPPNLKILIREPEDPLAIHTRPMERGGINVIDLANIDTCAFIETQDIGLVSPQGFEVLGRFDNSDIRGCNLLVL